MINWYITCRNHIRAISAKAVDALAHCDADETQATKTIANYMRSDFQRLKEHWHSRYPETSFGNLSRHLSWAEKCDFNDILLHDLPAVEEKLDQLLADFAKSLPNSQSASYISEERISEIAEIQSSKFDTRKLIQLMNELNNAYICECPYSVGIIVRAIIDHVPPIFELSSFHEVANNYKGTKSFKHSMQHLNNSLRSFADSYLHLQIRRSESLPNKIQIDFRADLDALLSEVARLLRE
jgi:hypothetical protein